MATIWIIAIIISTAALVAMSNAVHNWPPLKSTSLVDLLEQLIHRHIVASPITFIMLFALPKVMGRFGILIDLLFMIASGIWLYQNVTAERQRQRYIASLRPNYPCNYVRVRLDPQINRRFGGQVIHYMFICPKTKVITFPESKYHNQRKYYLLNLDFKPKYGPNYERLTYTGMPFTRKSLFKAGGTNGKSFTEIPTVAIATFESIKTSQKIRLRLHDEISNRIAKLRADVYQSPIKPV